MPRLQTQLQAVSNVGNIKSENTYTVEPSSMAKTSLKRDRAFLLTDVGVGGQLQTAVQQVHIISSEDEADLEAEAGYEQKRVNFSDSGNSVCTDFAGFPSPGNTLLNVTPRNSKDSLVRDGLRDLGGEGEGADGGDKTGKVAVPKAHKRGGSSHAAMAEKTPLKGHKEKQNLRLTTREHFQTPPAQIVEINSNSTSNSRKAKRLKLQKSLKQSSQLQQQTPNANNRCSTETSSEFPVSSPSNPFAGRGNKYPKRPPLLKNTLPADAFERNLALITTRNPQMSLAEKMSTWQCDAELSDVEDVNNFDDLFKKYEDHKRKFMRTKKFNKELQGSSTATSSSSVNLVIEEQHEKYDFSQFRARMRNLAHIRKEANKLKEYDADKPTTSSAVVVHAGLRRPKANTVNTNASTYNSVSAESRKRTQQRKKIGKNSTTPQPSTSSSDCDVRRVVDDNDVAQQHTQHCYPSPKKKPHLQKQPPQADVLVQSSSEENSQDASHAKPRYLRSATASQLRPTADQHASRMSLSATATASSAAALPPLLVHCGGANTDEESVFMRHRLNREIDKQARTFANIAEEQQGLIQMRLDFLNDKKSLHLKERARELFKTPTVPQKYLTPSTPVAAYYKQQLQQQQQMQHLQQHQLLYHNPTTQQCPSNKKNNCSSQLTANHRSAAPTFVTEQLQAPMADGSHSFHQQHEFCNYLGLTGMSTAHAVANAVAELAKCNMTRRSLRVQRLQQLERRDRSTKNNTTFDESKVLQALKMKQLRELKRRVQFGKNEIAPQSPIKFPTVAQQSYHMSPQALDSQYNVATATATAAVKFKIEPEIKILCQISSTNKEEVEIVSRDCAKQLVAPIRQTLLRHLKSKRVATGNPSSNDNSTCPRSLHSDDEQLKAKRRVPTPTPSHTPRQRFLQRSGGGEQDSITGRSTPQAHIKSEPPPSCRSVKSPQCSESISKRMKVADQQQFQEKLYQESAENYARMQLLRDKFQKCLEASRKTKPSIFIVKSLASVVETGAKTLELPKLQCHNSTIQTTRVNRGIGATATSNLTSKSLALSRSTTTIVKSSKMSKRRQHLEQLATNISSGLHNFKTQSRLHKLITRSGNNMRQLRSRKIYIVKAKKHSKTGKMNRQPTDKVDKSTLTCDMMKITSSSKVQALLQGATLASEQVSATSAQTQSMIAIAPTDEAMRALFDLETKMDGAVHTDVDAADLFLPLAKRQSLEDQRSSPLRDIHANLCPQSVANVDCTRDQLPPHKILTNTFQMLGAASDTKEVVEEAVKEEEMALAREPELDHTPSNNNNNTLSRPAQTLLENETVVVSSTTNTYDENMLSGRNISNIGRSSGSKLPVLTKEIYQNCTYHGEGQEARLQRQHLNPLVTQDSATQCYATTPPSSPPAHGTGGIECTSIHYLAAPPKTLQNPLQCKYGEVLYIYYELDVLIVVQQWLVSFWKYSKLINVLALATSNQHLHATTSKQSQASISGSGGCSTAGDAQVEGGVMDISGEWLQLGECNRLVNDIEIATPYANRMCMHNSMPLYVEMRCRELTHERRDCNLLSMYINIYYYHDDEMQAKTHSIQLDTVQSLSSTVIYTAIPESRYFVMSWPQENILGRIRSGLCKYSLTPQLDTLASIREFKSMRHELLYLECTVDDKLLGFGATQLTIWDHRSGDVLMNYDLDLPLGRNLGSIYYPSVEIGQNNIILLFQYVQHDEADEELMLQDPPEMLVIACSISHSTPSHRVLQRQQLPQPAFDVIKSAINTGEHLLITALSDEEIWISCADPNVITCFASQHSQRFYSRGRTQFVELTTDALTVDSFANHVLKLAAATPTNGLNLTARVSADIQSQVM